jgi:hypothetical protein
MATPSPLATVVSTLQQTFLTTIGPTDATVEAAVKAQAFALAQGLATVAAQHGALTSAQAEAWIKSYVSAAEAGLALDVASLAGKGETLVVAGLKALVDMGLGTVGWGWLGPSVNAVIDTLTSPAAAAPPPATPAT